MKKVFTLEYLVTNKGCYHEKDVPALYPADKETVTIEELIDHPGMSIGDKLWFIIRKCDLTNKQKHELVLYVAENIVSIYEDAYPKYKTPRLAIALARQYIAGYVNIEVLKKRSNATAMLTAIAFNEAKKDLKPEYASTAVMSVNSALLAVNSSTVEAVYESEYINNACVDSVEKATTALDQFDTAKKTTGKKEFTDLMITFIKDFIAKN